MRKRDPEDEVRRAQQEAAKVNRRGKSIENLDRAMSSNDDDKFIEELESLFRSGKRG